MDVVLDILARVAMGMATYVLLLMLLDAVRTVIMGWFK
jgi:hypothetical protein